VSHPNDPSSRHRWPTNDNDRSYPQGGRNSRVRAPIRPPDTPSPAVENDTPVWPAIEEPSATPPEPVPANKRRRLIVAVIGVLVIGAGTFAGIAMLGNGGGRPNVAAPAPGSPSQSETGQPPPAKAAPAPPARHGQPAVAAPVAAAGTVTVTVTPSPPGQAEPTKSKKAKKPKKPKNSKASK
jgi:hypothetical protein